MTRYCGKVCENGCARRAYLGTLDGANLIKLHRQSGKVSYLVYPDFETDPHPALLRSVKLSLRTREIDCFDYAASTNPPVLHRKETFLASDHPLHAKFARLTQQEEKHGLLDDSSDGIGTREGWSARLSESGLELRGHRLFSSMNDCEVMGPRKTVGRFNHGKAAKRHGNGGQDPVFSRLFASCQIQVAPW